MSFLLCRVSSAAIRSTALSTSTARAVISPKLPIGVGTMYKQPAKMLSPIYTARMTLTAHLPTAHPLRLFQGAALAAALLLSACGATPPKPNSTLPNDSGSGEINVTLPEASRQVIDINVRNTLLALAKRDGTLAARAMRDALLLEGVDTTTLTFIDADIAWLEGDTAKADKLLNSIRSINRASRDVVLTEKYRRALVRSDAIGAVSLAYERLQLHTNARPKDRQALIDNVWSALMRLDQATIEQLKQREGSADWRGWLTLRSIYQSSTFQTNKHNAPANSRETVIAWLKQNTNHSAAITPPSGLLAWLETQPPATIAVLLPLSDKLASVGEALLEGVIEGLFDTYPSLDTRPTLITLDSNAFSNSVEAYKSARARGADLVIGPLTKSQVQQLGMMPTRDIPVIALNRPDGLVAGETNRWSALSLAPEDEAAQLAQLAFGRGHRRAVVIRPDTDWGRRMEAALHHTWRAEGGVLVDTLVLRNEPSLSEQVSKLVGGYASEARVRAVEAAFDAPVEARPRRRQDFDSVFMLLQTPDDARTLRPLLVFHYSGDVAVFAPSSVHSGQQRVQNRDLNDVIFLEIPAVLYASKVDRFTRLKALGYDAMKLSHHWSQAEQGSLPLVLGNTGLLTRQANGDVKRELIPTEFAGDKARPLRLP